MPTKQDLLQAADQVITAFLRSINFKKEGTVRHTGNPATGIPGVYHASFACSASRGKSTFEKSFKLIDGAAFVAGPVMGVASAGLSVGGISASSTPDGTRGSLGFGPQHVVAIERRLHRRPEKSEHQKRLERDVSLQKQNRLCHCVARFKFGDIPIPADTLPSPSGGFLPAGPGMPNLIEIDVGICRLASRGGPAGEATHPEPGQHAWTYRGYFTVRSQPISRQPNSVGIHVLTAPGQTPAMNQYPGGVVPVPNRSVWM